MNAGVSVYWKPGCTSCLRVRQFLADHGVAFASYNVLADQEAWARLNAQGIRSVPVVTRGGDFVFAQELDDVARFLGLPMRGARLGPAVLAERIKGLLLRAIEMARLIPPAALATKIKGRDRSYADIAYHIGQIVVGCLDAVRGGELTAEHFERKAPAPIATPQPIVDSLTFIARDFDGYWAASGNQLPSTVATYYGRQPLHQVLERTAWHMAQHCRQLQHILGELGVTGGPFLTPALLAGLPLPRDVWDPEIRPETTAA